MYAYVDIYNECVLTYTYYNDVQQVYLVQLKSIIDNET